MKKHLSARFLSLMLVVALLAGFAVPVGATSGSKVTFTQVDNDSVTASLREEIPENAPEEPAYADTDMVRVSIVLEDKSTIEAGYSVQDIAKNTAAMSYRHGLQSKQDAVIASIQKATGNRLDVVWNLTLAANIVSANVPYGEIESIENTKGVKEVLIETRYEPDVVKQEETADPNMATSGKQIGSTAAWAEGYTGAGSRVAVIDTGLDITHQSFDGEAFLYSLTQQAGEHGEEADAYIEGLNLLDAAEVESLKDQLNVAAMPAFDPETSYISSKVPYAFNYVDEDNDVDHIHDTQEEHGSHVAGIATANTYIPQEDGSFTRALDTVYVQGVAPDAQLLVMKVFGKAGGAYDSDYMVAIEDAIVLGCDSVNLSLGSGNPGMSRNSNAAYQAILDSLTEAGIVVCISAGNSGSWVENAQNLGYLYASDVSMQTNGSPGSFTNTLTSASVDNDGTTGAFLTVGENNIFYSETNYTNKPMSTLAGDQEFVFIDGFGTAEDWAAIGDALAGKIALCSRGEISFYQKADFAAKAGAAATIIYNNQPGVINMDLSDYTGTAPAVSITQADGALVKAAATPVTDEEGNVLYYTGTMNVSDGIGVAQKNSEFYTMSDFSSWGVPGSLELKPEITAPGGSIYSVYGTNINSDSGQIAGGKDAYEVMSGTSMASPQVAGMVAVAAQYIREQGLVEKTGLTPRQLLQSLLMSTAEPIVDGNSGCYYPVIQQGSGLANVNNVINADSYIRMGEDATKSWADGKVKAELGDDPDREGVYSFSFSINNMDGKAHDYNLFADFFTQDIFAYYANGNQSMDELAYYMDTYAVNMPVNLTWEVDGKVLEPAGDEVEGMDFNGDGVVNAADGQALLDYVVGSAQEIQNVELADLDADDDIDTFDAYLFFKLYGTGSVTVPADGSVTVKLTVELTDAWDEYYEASENGIYVEGYVYAKSAATEEGEEGTCHSIPVLGFYGNWSDPSMLDVGNVSVYTTGEEVRIPYLGKPNANAWVINYGNEPGADYAFGGNPLVPDQVYMPERNAINSQNGDQIAKVQFTAIRNAAASRYTAVNNTTGEMLDSSNLGAVNSAFYYTNGGSWQNTGYTLRTKFTPKGNDEGDRITLALTLVPEYYVDAEGNVDWEALGKGASFEMPMVVDNTAPQVKDVSVSLVNNTMTVVAGDNQYVAAVALFNKAGTSAYAVAGAKQDAEAGATASYTLDLNGVNGKKFLVQVFDYAMNVSTYEVNMQIGEEQPIPEMIAFNAETGNWIGFDKNATPEEMVDLASSNVVITAGCDVEGMIFASDDSGNLYVIAEDDPSDVTLVANTGYFFTDMAYNQMDETLYGISEGVLYAIDKLNGGVKEIGEILMDTNTLACDDAGNFYSTAYGDTNAITNRGYLYTYTLADVENGVEPTQITQPTYVEGSTLDQSLHSNNYIQSLAWNPNDGRIYWASYCYLNYGFFSFVFGDLYAFDPATGVAEDLNDNQDELTSLVIPVKTSGGGSWTEPTDVVTGVQISQSEITLLKGATTNLSASVQPWTASNRSVTWESDNEAVATVTENGLVTAVNPGTATITATSVLNPEMKATCTVTVDTVKVTLKGTLQDANGDPMFYTWNMENDETWTGGTALDSSMTSATMDTVNNKLYMMDAVEDVWSMHLIDPATGETEASSGANAVGVPMWDMSYSEFLSTAEAPKVNGIYNYYLLPGKDPMALDGSAFNLQSRLSSGGASYLVAIATVGTEMMEEDDGSLVETEHLVMLDNAGNLWSFWIYPTAGGSFSAWAGGNASDLKLDFPGNGQDMYCSMVQGGDGALYLSAFNGETNEIYRLTYNEATEAYESAFLGDVGGDVWPATITSAESNDAAAAGSYLAPAENLTKIEAETVTQESLVKAEIGDRMNAVAPANKATGEAPEGVTLPDDLQKAVEETTETAPETEKPASTISVTLTAKDQDGNAVASTNGLMTAAYDPENMVLTNVTISGNYTSKVEADGSVTFGYVSLDGIPAGEAVATLTFLVKDLKGGQVTVEHKQVNNVALTYTETMPVVCDHANTEIRNAKEATCTEAGYTGDTYCTVCGALISLGEIIPATECPSKAFVDLDTSRWYHEGVDYVLNKGLMIGVSGNQFAPNDQLTRAQMVTILYRMAGSPEVKTNTPFTDVAEHRFFTKAVAWAYQEGIAKGMTDTLFMPNASVTREQMVTFFARYAAFAGHEVTSKGNLESFTDSNKVSTFAVASMTWAYENGIIKGMTATTLEPKGTATRAQAATMIMRLANLLEA